MDANKHTLFVVLLLVIRCRCFSTLLNHNVLQFEARSRRLPSARNSHSVLAVDSPHNLSATLWEQGSVQAGTDGYSLLRQPLTKSHWDPSRNPRFQSPILLQDDKNTNEEVEGGKHQQLASDPPVAATVPVKAGLPDRIDILQRSLDTLDVPRLLEALEDECTTLPGRRIVQQASPSTRSGTSQPVRKVASNCGDTVFATPLVADTLTGVHKRYDAVREMESLMQVGLLPAQASFRDRQGYRVALGNGNPPPFHGLSFDLDSIWKGAADGKVLGGSELLQVAGMLNAMEDMQLWIRELTRFSCQHDTGNTSSNYTALPTIIEGIQLNTTLQQLLNGAFDELEQLSGTTFPTLDRLRKAISSFKEDILQTMENLVSLPSIQSKLALESGGPLYSEIANGGGRLVLPLDPEHAYDVGIVHDSSRSGKTVYVEPSEVVGLTNELRHCERQLEAEEARIWRLLTEEVWVNRMSIEQSVQAVGQLDLAMARARLGKRLDGIIPQVLDEGVVSLRDAKHPLLLLRNSVNVVGSDIDLGANGNRGLVLTGPNSGGKTVILKLLGLLAFMAKSGIPIPAKSGSEETYCPRVDFFHPILADIGDIQSVDGDLSTFSGHMLACRQVLEHAGSRALVLMDELGSGTDPAQGVAIAQAVLEALLETGCYVTITTHYMALKNFAASDPRFAVAAMQFLGGLPTYKLLPGEVGASFALAVAERLKLPSSILNRARELMNTDTQKLGELVEEMERQKSELEQNLAAQQQELQELEEAKKAIQRRQETLDRQMLTARQDEADKFAKELAKKEESLKGILEKLKSNPSRKVIVKSWNDIRVVKNDAIGEAAKVPNILSNAAEAVQRHLVSLADDQAKPELNVGDRLTVCKPGPLFGKTATVIKDLGKKVQVEVSGMSVDMKLGQLSSGVPSTSESDLSLVQLEKSRRSRAADRALQYEPDRKRPSRAKPAKHQVSFVFRTSSNTVDVRGHTFAEAKEVIESSMSEMALRNQPAMFILHGHGSAGTLKRKIRSWLESKWGIVKGHSAAEQSEGGDAFTMVQLT